MNFTVLYIFPRNFTFVLTHFSYALKVKAQKNPSVRASKTPFIGLKYLFLCRDNKMSRGFKCCNADSNRGPPFGGLVACNTTSVPSTVCQVINT